MTRRWPMWFWLRSVESPPTSLVRGTVHDERNNMRRFVLTGAPGAGKTAIIRQLELDGFSVVEEAATIVIAAAHARGIAEPWKQPSFIDEITALQKTRQIRASCQQET